MTNKSRQFVYACFPSIRDPFFDSETTRMLWKSDSNDKYAFEVQPKRMDISRPESVSHSQHLYPATRLPVDLYRFTDANGMMLVFNIDSRSSFDALTHLIDARNEDVKSNKVEPKVLCVVGNKLDKSRDKRKILCLEGEALASRLGCPYLECSAKDANGLDKVKSAVIKAMETQQSQLQYAQQQRERAVQGSRLNHKISLMRRLSGGSSPRSETPSPRITHSNEFNSNQQMTRNQRHRNGAIISPSGRYRGGLIASSLPSEDRIEEEDEETESDEKSRSSSQQSSNTSTKSKKSSVTVTPPSNALSIRPSYSQRLTMERLPPAAMTSLPPVSEQPLGMVRSLSDAASYTSAGPHKRATDGLSITTPAHVSDSGGPLQYRSAPKEEEKLSTMPVQSHELPPVSPHGVSPQHMFNTQSTSHSRDQSPELLENFQSSVFHSLIQPSNPFQLPQLKFSEPMSPASEEKRKLDEERAQLEEEKEKLRQEMQELQERQTRLEDRRRGEVERRQIEEERKKIVEERKRVDEERQNLKEAKRLIEEQEDQWKHQQNFPSDEPQADHSPTLDENFEGIFPGIELQVDTKHEGNRRYHQEQFQQERQQDLQLRSTTSSSSSIYSVQRDYTPVQRPAVPPDIPHHHPLRGHPVANPTSPQKEPKLLRRSSLRTTRLAPRSESSTARSSSDKEHSATPPLSPDITQTFRRFLNGKKEPKKQPSTDQRETMRFVRDELGITMPQIPVKDPPPRSPKSLLLPPGTKIENREDVTRTKKVATEARSKLPFPGSYI